MAYKYFLDQYNYTGTAKGQWMTPITTASLVLKPQLFLTYKKQWDSIIINPNELGYANSFKDVAISLKTKDNQNSYFDLKEPYYCRFAIRKGIEQNQNFTIKLAKTTDGEADGIIIQKQDTDYQFIKNIQINGSDTQNIWEIQDLIFIPQQGDFNTVLFELVRTNFDFGATEEGTERIPNIIFLEFSKVNDLKTIITQEGKTEIVNALYRKIGVQANPGFRMLINKEEIFVGRTGFYELKNQNIKIESFGVIHPVQKWGDKTYANIENDLLNFKEEQYFTINNKQQKIINNNNYNYYTFANSNRIFPSFVLDYVYELEITTDNDKNDNTTSDNTTNNNITGDNTTNNNTTDNTQSTI